MADVLFDRVVELCGFSAYVGPGAVRRSLDEAGCRSEGASPADYRQALPSLKRRLRVYLEEEEAQARVELIENMLEAAEKGALEDKPAPAEALEDDETHWGKRRFGKTVAILQKAREGLDGDEKK